MVNTIERVNVGGTKVAPRLARVFGLMAAVGVLAGSPSCSFIVDKTANQCEADADCATRGDYKQCSAEKLCIKPVVTVECTTNQQCLDNDPNANKICRKSDGTCVPLRTAECQTIDGDPARDDAFMIGSVLPTTPGADDAFGKPVELAIQLALSEIRTQKSGIPTATAGVYRPLLYIGCTDTINEEDASLKAAKHLAEELQVPAIIGEAFSGVTQEIANIVTIKAGTLLISPAATSDSLTKLDDLDLVWRTSPPDTLQSAALKLYVPDVETKVRANFVINMMSPDAPVRIAIINNTDSYGTGLAEGVLASPALQINGMAVNAAGNAANYRRKEYADGDLGGVIAVAKEMAEDFKPDIVLLFAFNDATDIMNKIEDLWKGDAKRRPQYVFSDAVAGSVVTEAIKANLLKDDLRPRVTGTIPGTTKDEFINFVERYNLKYQAEKASYPADTFGAAGGYDAVFLLTYAAATLNGAIENGKGLAAGMKLLSDTAAPLVNAGAKNLPGGFTDLKMKGTINYNGASGPLDFDPATGEAKSDIQIWCVNSTLSGTPSSGLFYDALKSQLDGAFTPCN